MFSSPDEPALNPGHFLNFAIAGPATSKAAIATRNITLKSCIVSFWLVCLFVGEKLPVLVYFSVFLAVLDLCDLQLEDAAFI